jgi:ATP-dependent Zn protease
MPIYTDADYFRMAVHEVGHALIALAVGYASSATIEISRIFDSAAWYRGGLTDFEIVKNNIPTEASMLNSIAVGYGGMAAEAVVFEARSVGSGGVLGSDLERVTGIARRMIGSYGFGKTPGYLGAGDVLGGMPLPERFEKEAMKILDGQYNRVLGILAGENSRIVSLAADAVAHRSLKLGLSNTLPPERA